MDLIISAGMKFLNAFGIGRLVVEFIGAMLGIAVIFAAIDRFKR